MHRETLIVFVKAPRPGSVKTRLAASLGEEAACTVYRRLVGFLLKRLEGLPDVTLQYAPVDGLAEVTPWRRNGWKVSPQGAGDLGLRLRTAFDDAFSSGYRKVAVIGSDCPHLIELDIRRAWAALGQSDLVLGPAHDGGYWLIALSRPWPRLFEDIPWSTESVLKATLARARELGVRTRLLRSLPDIDTEQDWREFQKDPERFATESFIRSAQSPE